VIASVGVVVPAHNEETLLPDCLAALQRAARGLRIPVHVLVAADACTDRTEAVARAAGARVAVVSARRVEPAGVGPAGVGPAGVGPAGVGTARAVGMTELLRLMTGSEPEAVWLATTDADTVVPPGWLRRQLRYAAQGWDVVLGTVAVTGWSEHPPYVPAAFAARYESGNGPHPHVHGANLGIRASAYLAAGGFRPLRTAEDHALLAAATRVGCTVLRASDITVQTSARRQGRAPDGFSDLLRMLAREHALS
jgi:glycosyltransferase involved in cell wall biosynthesis